VQGIGPDSWALLVVPTGGQWRYLVLPALTLASAHTAVVARLTRAGMAEVAETDYARTAAAKGLGPKQVFLRHGLKNVMIPVVTLLGLDLASFIGSAIITEAVFGWPGIGTAMLQAVNALDAPVVLGLTIAVVVASLAVNLAVDISYAALDPRVRYGRRGVT
jgi:peptide/nickel transport system permease protein